MDLCLSLFPREDFRHTYGTIMLYVGLNHDGYLPELVRLTDGKTTDIDAGQVLAFPAGSMVACDRSYTHYGRYNPLTQKLSTPINWLSLKVNGTAVK